MIEDQHTEKSTTDFPCQKLVVARFPSVEQTSLEDSVRENPDAQQGASMTLILTFCNAVFVVYW